MKLLESIKNDFLELLPPPIFFFVAFVLILSTKRMILGECQISWTGFGAAVVGAILAGKVVLMVDKLPFFNRFPDRPLIYNSLWKSLLFSGRAGDLLSGPARSLSPYARRAHGS